MNHPKKLDAALYYNVKKKHPKQRNLMTTSTTIKIGRIHRNPMTAYTTMENMKHPKKLDDHLYCNVRYEVFKETR